MITVDWTITVGNLLSIASFFGGGLAAILTMRADIRLINVQIAGMQEQLSTLRQVMIGLARQDERIKAVEKAVDDLRHGKGFIMEEFAGKRII